MAPWRSIPSCLHKFAALENRQKTLVMEAALCLALARLILLTVPFRHVSPHLGELVAPDDPRVAACRQPADVHQTKTAECIRRAVASAARHVPFEAVCLPQAMAAQTMLHRRGIAGTLHLGAAMDDSKTLDAHAWLDAAGVPVTGYPYSATLSEIACFVSRGT
jgi:hypothetical protein